MRIFFLIIITAFSISSFCLGMESQIHSNSEWTAQNWTLKYLDYFDHPKEREMLLGYLANRRYLNRLYRQYHAHDFEEKKQKKERELLLKRYLQHYCSYKNYEAGLEICAITSGYACIKEQAYEDLDDLIPVPPQSPYDKQTFFDESQLTNNVQKLVDVIGAKRYSNTPKNKI